MCPLPHSTLPPYLTLAPPSHPPCRLQCCGLKAAGPPSSAAPRPQDLCGSTRDGGRKEAAPSLLSPRGPGPGPPAAMLAPRRASANQEPGAPAADNGPCGKTNHSKGPAGPAKSASIRDKISQWEGKKEPSPPSPPSPPSLPSLPGPPSRPGPPNSVGPAVARDDEPARRKEPKASEVQRSDSKRLVSWERRDSGSVGKPAESKTGKDREAVLERRPRPARPAEPPQQDTDKKSVLTHVKKLEMATKEAPDRPSLAFPGNYFCPPARDEQEESEPRPGEPVFGTFDWTQRSRGSWRRREGDADNVYNEPGGPSINPLPKPQRTFQHHTPPSTPTTGPGPAKGRRTLPPLPAIPPPPLPTCPPPGVCRRPWADRLRDSNNR